MHPNVVTAGNMHYMIVSLNNLTTSFQFFADIHFVLHFVMFMQMLNSAVFHLLVAAIVFDSIGHIAMCKFKLVAVMYASSITLTHNNEQCLVSLY